MLLGQPSLHSETLSQTTTMKTQVLAFKELILHGQRGSHEPVNSVREGKQADRQGH